MELIGGRWFADAEQHKNQPPNRIERELIKFLSLLPHHDEQLEASQPPSSLPHCLFCQPPTPGPLLSMMRPLFHLPLSGGSPLSVTSSPPDREAHPPPPALPAPPHSSPRSISVISIARDEGKVSILCDLHGITSKTHLFMFDGMVSAVPRLMSLSPPRAAGDSPLLLSLIDINQKEL
jgi:hypothetical protein